MRLSNRFIRPETAWMLKGKGFNDHCNWGYTEHGEGIYLEGDIGNNNKSMYSSFCTAPLQDEVTRWFRAKNIHLYALPIFEFNDGREDFLQLKGFSVYVSYYPNKKLAPFEVNTEVYSSYEEALESGIVDILKSDIL